MSTALPNHYSEGFDQQWLEPLEAAASGIESLSSYGLNRAYAIWVDT